jgi:hypothetical protein
MTMTEPGIMLMRGGITEPTVHRTLRKADQR